MPASSRAVPVLTVTGAALAALAFALLASGLARGRLPAWPFGPLLLVPYVAAIACGFATARALGGAGGPPLLRRHGFWLVVIAGALLLPRLGASPLWDPWETHYGEVAREILARRDPISLWWAHEGFFYSKPVLLFWLEALSLAVLGADVRPDHVLDGGAAPEWAIRLPNALLAIGALYILYRGVAKTFGRPAAFFGAIVLMTTAFASMLAAHATTDTPFVATLSAAMGLFIAGVATPDDVRVSSRGWRHASVVAIAAAGMAQGAYLLSCNLDRTGFRADRVPVGSPGNCGAPGDAPCSTVLAAHAFPPALQGAMWLAGAALLVATCWREDRARRLCFLGAWGFAALSVLAKGPAGVVLPVLCALSYLATTRRWRDVTTMMPMSGLLVVAIVALPWYVAAYVRHGAPFTDELIFKDMLRRAFGHVHDTNEGDDTSFVYYVAQLGYGLFPWTGLAPLGLLVWMRERGARAEAATVLFAWFLLAFALFTAMGTKFHHYVYPAVPPIAMLVGVALDRARTAVGHERRMIAGAGVAGALLTALVGRDLAGRPEGAIHFAQLFSYLYRRPWPEGVDLRAPLAAFATAMGAAMLLLAAPPARARTWAPAVLGAMAVAFAAWGLDVYLARTAPHWGQGEVMRAYYRDRSGPDEPLVAYQMNWKGENFYSGNHVAKFVTTGAPFTRWLDAERARGTRAVYVVVERSRVAGLEREAAARAYREVTPRAASQQFTLVRATL